MERKIRKKAVYLDAAEEWLKKEHVAIHYVELHKRMCAEGLPVPAGANSLSTLNTRMNVSVRRGEHRYARIGGGLFCYWAYRKEFNAPDDQSRTNERIDDRDLESDSESEVKQQLSHSESMEQLRVSILPLSPMDGEIEAMQSSYRMKTPRKSVTPRSKMTAFDIPKFMSDKGIATLPDSLEFLEAMIAIHRVQEERTKPYPLFPQYKTDCAPSNFRDGRHVDANKIEAPSDVITPQVRILDGSGISNCRADVDYSRPAYYLRTLHKFSSEEYYLYDADEEDMEWVELRNSLYFVERLPVEELEYYITLFEYMHPSYCILPALPKIPTFPITCSAPSAAYLYWRAKRERVDGLLLPSLRAPANEDDEIDEYTTFKRRFHPIKRNFDECEICKLCCSHENNDMISCDGPCERWFHQKCYGVGFEEKDKDGDWLCKECSKIPRNEPIVSAATTEKQPRRRGDRTKKKSLSLQSILDGESEISDTLISQQVVKLPILQLHDNGRRVVVTPIATASMSLWDRLHMLPGCGPPDYIVVSKPERVRLTVSCAQELAYLMNERHKRDTEASAKKFKGVISACLNPDMLLDAVQIGTGGKNIGDQAVFAHHNINIELADESEKLDDVHVQVTLDPCEPCPGSPPHGSSDEQHDNREVHAVHNDDSMIVVDESHNDGTRKLQPLIPAPIDSLMISVDDLPAVSDQRDSESPAVPEYNGLQSVSNLNLLDAVASSSLEQMPTPHQEMADGRSSVDVAQLIESKKSDGNDQKVSKENEPGTHKRRRKRQIKETSEIDIGLLLPVYHLEHNMVDDTQLEAVVTAMTTDKNDGNNEKTIDRSPHGTSLGGRRLRRSVLMQDVQDSYGHPARSSANSRLPPDNEIHILIPAAAAVPKTPTIRRPVDSRIARRKVVRDRSLGERRSTRHAIVATKPLRRGRENIEPKPNVQSIEITAEMAYIGEKQRLAAQRRSENARYACMVRVAKQKARREEAMAQAQQEVVIRTHTAPVPISNFSLSLLRHQLPLNVLLSYVMQNDSQQLTMNVVDMQSPVIETPLPDVGFQLLLASNLASRTIVV